MRIMFDDKQIRKFMHDSRPVVGKDGFMEDFVRQSALLPQPASMLETEDTGKIEKLEALYRIASLTKKANRIDALAWSASAIAVCLLCFTIFLSASAIFPAL